MYFKKLENKKKKLVPNLIFKRFYCGNLLTVPDKINTPEFYVNRNTSGLIVRNLNNLHEITSSLNIFATSFKKIVKGIIPNK